MNGDDTNIDKNGKDTNPSGLPGQGRSFDPMFAQSWQKPTSPKAPPKNTAKPDPEQEQELPADAEQPTADAQSSDSPDDILFAPSSPEEGLEDGDSQSFDEAGRSRWGGRAMTPDEMGLPVPSEPGYMQADDELAIDSEQELELIDGAQPRASDDDIVLEDDAAPQEEQIESLQTTQDDLLNGEVFVLDEGTEADASGIAGEGNSDGEQPVEDGWEPLSATRSDAAPTDAFEDDGGAVNADGEEIAVESDDVDGQDESLETEDTEQVEFENHDEFASHEDIENQDEFAALDEQVETAQDADAEFESEEQAEPVMVTKAPARTGRILRFLTRAAAAAILVGAGAVAVLHPEWIGLTLEPELVQRVHVARPNLNPKAPKPVAPQVAKNEPAAPAVETAPNVAVAQPAEPTPAPTTQPTPVEPEPKVAVVEQPAPAVEPMTTTENPVASQKLPHYLPAGETLWVGSFDGSERATAAWASVTPGSKAFAQLANGNFFIGSVKAVAADALVLAVKQGEVMLPRAEIRKVTTLDSRDYADLQRATQGFLKLSNDNRLVGEILQTVGDDHYVLQMQSDRIVVPRSAVQQVVERGGSEGVRFGSVGDEEQWLRGVAERQLQSQRTGTSLPKPTNTGSAQQSQPQIPVKQEQRKAPGSAK